jgi:hypothetical protein
VAAEKDKAKNKTKKNFKQPKNFNRVEKLPQKWQKMTFGLNKEKW